MTPKDLTPVIAEIQHLNDLGISKWYEVVYHCPERGWSSYAGSNTFKDGEKVLQWKYCTDVF